jgi:hypothetical protein
MDSGLQAWLDPPVHFPRRRRPFCKIQRVRPDVSKLNQAQGKHGIFTNSRRWLGGYLVLGLLGLGPSVSGFARQHAEVVQDLCFAAAVRM